MEYKEYHAKTIDEAITMASVDLGVTSSELYYEVTEKGSSGILGFGKKDFIIKACRLSDRDNNDVVEKSDVQEKSTEEVKDIKPQIKENTDKTVEKELRAEKPEKHERHEKSERELPSNVDVELITNTAREFLKDVFNSMDLTVESDIKFSDKDNSLSIDLSGDHMGIIIGKRGQTLDSLQYLVNLVVNKKSETYIRIKLDTEDYRRRRKETLENLARNIAHKVKRSGKPVTLEAMNPYERRTIHYALQKDRYVTTYSEGEEPFRHVVITVKK